MIINIEKYGDFDMPYTALLMLSPEGMGKKSVYQLIDKAADLFETSDDIDGVEKYLKEYGCVNVKSVNFTIGGNL